MHAYGVYIFNKSVMTNFQSGLTAIKIFEANKWPSQYPAVISLTYLRTCIVYVSAENTSSMCLVRPYM